MSEIDDARGKLQKAVETLESAVEEMAKDDPRGKLSEAEGQLEKTQAALQAMEQKNREMAGELKVEREQNSELREAVEQASSTVDRLVGQLRGLLEA